jgi:uncharacterized membrane protein YvbJ
MILETIMKTNRLKRITAAGLLICSMYAVPAFSADVLKKVVFAKGKNTATYKGRLPGEYASYDAYVLRVRKGQRITVKLTTDDADASFSIFETQKLGPDEDLIFDSKPDYRQFSGLAPITSEYSIQIYGVKAIDDKPSRAAYTVEITVLN